MNGLRIAALGLFGCAVWLAWQASPSYAQYRTSGSQYNRGKFKSPQLAEYQRRLEAARRERARYVPDFDVITGRNAARRSYVPTPSYVPTRRYPAYYPYYPRVVGYQPNITWLPTGATLNAAAVVSPDGRHVRVNAQPFFSHVPAVHTYNLRTGETRRIR
jgi:hypothetical protein